MNDLELWGFETFIEYLTPALKLAHGYITDVEFKRHCPGAGNVVDISYTNGVTQRYILEERDTYKSLALKIFMNLLPLRDF